MVLRDGGTTLVLLRDASGQQQGCRFDYSIASRTRGRLYLPDRSWLGLAKSEPVPLDGEAHCAVLEVIARHLNSNYTPEEQEALAALDGSGGFRGISKRDHEGYLLMFCARELKRLAQD